MSSDSGRPSTPPPDGSAAGAADVLGEMPARTNRREFLGASAAATVPLFLGATRPGWAATPALGLVTADQEAHVAVVNLARARVTRRIRTLEGPHSIQSGPGDAILVGHPSEGAVTLLEGRPPRVRRVLRGFS